MTPAPVVLRLHRRKFPSPARTYTVAQRTRRLWLRTIASVELRHAEELTRLGWTGPRSLRLDRAIALQDAVQALEMGAS